MDRPQPPIDLRLTSLSSGGAHNAAYSGRRWAGARTSTMTRDEPNISGYSFFTPIGEGGSARVWRALDLELGRWVAIKVLSARHSDDTRESSDAIARFHTECRLLGSLGDHPHVVSVHQCGVTNDGEPFMVMEWCSNGTAKARVKSEGPYEISQVLTLGVAIGGALSAAHGGERMVLHRDVKPENILFTATGRPVLADFGVAAIAIGGRARTGRMTPSHVAPEVVEGKAHSVASDVYSLASTLYELVDGHSPFFAPTQSIETLLERVVDEPARPPMRADMPAEFERTLMTALSKDPAERPATIALFVRRLQISQERLGLAPSVLWSPLDVVRRPAAFDELPQQSARNVHASGPSTRPDTGVHIGTSGVAVGGPPPAAFPSHSATPEPVGRLQRALSRLRRSTTARMAPRLEGQPKRALLVAGGLGVLAVLSGAGLAISSAISDGPGARETQDASSGTPSPTIQRTSPAAQAKDDANVTTAASLTATDIDRFSKRSFPSPDIVDEQASAIPLTVSADGTSVTIDLSGTARSSKVDGIIGVVTRWTAATSSIDRFTFESMILVGPDGTITAPSAGTVTTKIWARSSSAATAAVVSAKPAPERVLCAARVAIIANKLADLDEASWSCTPTQSPEPPSPIGSNDGLLIEQSNGSPTLKWAATDEPLWFDIYRVSTTAVEGPSVLQVLATLPPQSTSYDLGASTGCFIVRATNARNFVAANTAVGQAVDPIGASAPVCLP